MDPLAICCAWSATDARGTRFIGQEISSQALGYLPKKPIDLGASWNNIAERDVTAHRLPLPGHLRFPKCRCASRSAG
jgi:hypothetical protein